MVSLMPKGSMFVRSLLAIARAGEGGDPVAVAENHFGGRVAEITRAAVAAGSISSGDWGAVLATPEAAEFFALVEQASVVSRIPLRTVPLNIRTQLVSTGASVFWVGAGKPKPLSKLAVSGSVLTTAKIAGLLVVTRELMRASSPVAEARLRADLVRALAESLDSSFLDPDNAGVTDVAPASVTNGVAAIASVGSPAADIAALVEAFPGDFQTAAFVTDPSTAAALALARDAGGSSAFPDAGPRGGSILGLPLIASRSSPRTSNGGRIALIDGAGIAYGSDGIRTSVAEHASIDMHDDDTVTDGAVQQISMFQTHSIALLSEMSVNWKVVRPAVAVVEDCAYSVELES